MAKSFILFDSDSLKDFHKRIFLQAGIYEDNYRFAEDYFLWLKLASKNNFCFISFSFHFYASIILHGILFVFHRKDLRR